MEKDLYKYKSMNAHPVMEPINCGSCYTVNKNPEILHNFKSVGTKSTENKGLLYIYCHSKINK